jgi:L-aspartate oxidase
MKLLTGAPGWSTSADVIVIGSGVAGLTTACLLYTSDAADDIL